MEDKVNGPVLAIKNYLGNSLSLKAVMIGFIILLLLIPQSMVEDLVFERMDRSQEVIAEVSEKWGGKQVLSGPVLTLPITWDRMLKDANGKLFKDRLENTVHLYADELLVDGELEPNVRKRSIFKAILYKGDLKLKAKFKKPLISDFGLGNKWKIHFDRAKLSVGVTDTTGIASPVAMTFNGKAYEAKPSPVSGTNLDHGFHFDVNLDEKLETYSLEMVMTLKGHKTFGVLPSGRQSQVNLSSTWADPSFQGSFLATQRTVTDQGFEAEWQVHDLQRDFRQAWQTGFHQKGQDLIAVELLQVNDAYQRVLRVVKYAVLFIIFTFAAVFITERLTGAKVHPLQYFITGLASLMFYLLLLAISEQRDFNEAYIICSVLTTALITGYSKGIFRGWRVSSTMGGVCIFLYSFLFGTLQLQDYALLMGSVGLFVILAVVMFLTRKLNSEELAPLAGNRELA